ncbi:MAG TPA: PilZ domain-containing protein [Polyangiaceae bacterium]|jgi:hypothetical protein
MRLADLFRRSLSSLPWRRAHEREPAAVRVDWCPFGSAVHRVSTTADLSPGGAFVHTTEAMPPRSPIILALSTPRGEVEVHARVAWSDPRGMGVRFTRTLSAAYLA